MCVDRMRRRIVRFKISRLVVKRISRLVVKHVVKLVIRPDETEDSKVQDLGPTIHAAVE